MSKPKEIPRDVSNTISKSLSASLAIELNAKVIDTDEIHKISAAFAWVDYHSEYYDEMGG